MRLSFSTAVLVTLTTVWGAVLLVSLYLASAHLSTGDNSVLSPAFWPYVGIFVFAACKVGVYGYIGFVHSDGDAEVLECQLLPLPASTRVACCRDESESSADEGRAD